jgi:AraC family transcriptional regulator
MVQEDEMSMQLNVRIVTLPAMRVASFYGYGAEPEMMAHQKLAAWAGPRGLLQPNSGRLVFGFNNPSPSSGSPNYGYEFWMTLDADEDPGEGIDVKQFDGGLYAVTRCVGTQIIGEVWERLAAWRNGTHYRFGNHQWLEEHIDVWNDDQFVLDLFLPIVG